MIMAAQQFRSWAALASIAHGAAAKVNVATVTETAAIATAWLTSAPLIVDEAVVTNAWISIAIGQPAVVTTVKATAKVLLHSSCSA